MARYRVLSNNWRVDGNRGLRRIVPRRGFDVPAFPVHLAPSDVERTVCGLDTSDLREFKHSPEQIFREDRCERCYSERA